MQVALQEKNAQMSPMIELYEYFSMIKGCKNVKSLT